MASAFALAFALASLLAARRFSVSTGAGIRFFANSFLFVVQRYLAAFGTGRMAFLATHGADPITPFLGSFGDFIRQLVVAAVAFGRVIFLSKGALSGCFVLILANVWDKSLVVVQTSVGVIKCCRVSFFVTLDVAVVEVFLELTVSTWACVHNEEA